MKIAIQEMTTKIGPQEAIIKEMAEVYTAMETAISKIAEHVRSQNTFNVSMKNSTACPERRVRTQQDNFTGVARDSPESRATHRQKRHCFAGDGAVHQRDDTRF